MNSKRHLSNKVMEERKLGRSLGELSRKYRLSKSTISLWCKDMKLSKKAKALISENWLKKTTEARRKGSLTIRQKRIDSIEREYIKAKEIIRVLDNRDLLILGAGLYWAEGSKKETGSGFSFINSDPSMIKIVYKWLTEIINIKKEQLIIHLAINVIHKGREGEILKFWSNLLDFPIEDFGNTTFIKVPLRRQYSNHLNYFGMLRIKVRSSSWLRRRILGMIKVFNENADVAQVARASHS